MLKLVFVYGTLLQGERNHHFLNRAPFALAYLENCKLFNLGSYPGIIEGEGVILGELYRINDVDLKRLDYLEDNGDLYCRKEVLVKTLTKDYQAYVYVYNKEIPPNSFYQGKIQCWKKDQTAWSELIEKIKQEEII